MGSKQFMSYNVKYMILIISRYILYKDMGLFNDYKVTFSQ